MNKYDEAIDLVKNKHSLDDNNCNLIIEAFQQAKERENPQPLTIEQLKERVGKPVWLIATFDNSEKLSFWVLVDLNEDGRPIFINSFGGTDCIDDMDYIVECYDHEPKGK